MNLKKYHSYSFIAIVKVEAMEETSLPTMSRSIDEKNCNANFGEDESIFIGFDRLQKYVF
jgi:hypothetical protein